MAKAISNTSPLLYLHRIQAIEWLPAIFDEVWTTPAVVAELAAGKDKGFDVPDASELAWLRIVTVGHLPSEWLALDLGPGELSVLSLALENPAFTVLLDDQLARRTALAAGLDVWGTLKILLEAKSSGLTATIGPCVERLRSAGMWISPTVRRRIMDLAGE